MAHPEDEEQTRQLLQENQAMRQEVGPSNTVYGFVPSLIASLL
jgi:hypothetical protein